MKTDFSRCSEANDPDKIVYTLLYIVFCQSTVNCKIPYNSPSPSGRELEGGGNPQVFTLPSPLKGEELFIRSYAEDHIHYFQPPYPGPMSPIRRKIRSEYTILTEILLC